MFLASASYGEPRYSGIRERSIAYCSERGVIARRLDHSEPGRRGRPDIKRSIWLRMNGLALSNWGVIILPALGIAAVLTTFFTIQSLNPTVLALAPQVAA